MPMRRCLITCLALFVCSLASRAHPNLQDSMWVQFEPSLVHVAVNVSLREISVARGEKSAVNSIENAMIFALERFN
jgi:uncharacterized protein YcfL